MSLISALCVLAAFAAKASCIPVSQCKPLPDSPGWPSVSDWQKLNISVGGRLSAASPPGAVCHPEQADFNNASCAIVQLQWTNSSYHADNAFSTDYNDDACLPDAVAPCSSEGYPAFAIEAINRADVQAGVRFASETGVRLIVKGTGHDWAGRSKGPGSLEIWTHRLKSIDLCIQNHTASGLEHIGSLKIAAGMQWGEVYAYAAEHNFTVVGGGDPNVGIGGWILGGGHSPVSSLFGLGADQILEMEVVTADGEYRVINEASYPDLFWALRGGGGSTFAVMLSVTVKVYPSNSGTTVVLYYNTTAASDTFWSLAAHFHSHLPNMSEAGAMGYYGIVPVNGNPDQSVASTVVGEFFFPRKTPQQATEILSPLQNDLIGLGWADDLIHNSSAAYEFDDFTSFWLSNPPMSVGFDGRLGSWLLDGPALNTDPGSLKTQLKESTPLPNILLGHLVAGPGVREAQIPGGSNAVLPAWRKAYVHAGKFEAITSKVFTTDRIGAVLARTWTPLNLTEKAAVATELRDAGLPALKQLAPASGAYLNEADPTNPNWQQDYYGSNYARLLEVKKYWDPAGVFWCKPCVGHELWSIVDGPSDENQLEWGVGQSPGRICRK